MCIVFESDIIDMISQPCYELSGEPSPLCCVGTQIYVKVQSNTTCNVYTAKEFLHSLSQQRHVSAFS